MLREVHFGAVGVVAVERDVGGVGARERGQGGVVHPLDGGETEAGGALRKNSVEHNGGAVVVADRREARAAVGADKIVGRREPAQIAQRVAHIDTGLDRDRHAPRQVTRGVGERGALLVDRVRLDAVGRRERVGADLREVDGRTRGVGYGDRAGAHVVNIVEGNRDARATRDGAAEESLSEIAKRGVGLRVAEAGHGAPDGAVVAPRQAGTERRTRAMALAVGEPDLASAGGAARVRQREISRRDAVHEKGERVVVKLRAEIDAVDCEGEPVVGAEFVVNRGADRRARLGARAVAHGEVGEVGAVGRRVGQRGAVGHAERAAPGGHEAVGVVILIGGAGGEREAEALVYGHDGAEIETGADGAREPVVGRGRFAEVAGVVAHQDEDAAVEHRLGALESALRDHVHRAGERGAGRLGRR